MTDEKFLSGYCRQLDASRMVELVLEDGVLTEIDCGYPDCAFRPNCPIAKEIDELTDK